jgi:hypothetical protein
MIALPRPVKVRRLVAADQAAFEANPQGYAGEWISDPKDEHGDIMTLETRDVEAPGPNGTTTTVEIPFVWVAWENARRPAMEFMQLALLENVDNLYGDEEEEEE